MRRKKSLRSLKAGEAYYGMPVLWLHSLNLPPRQTTITQAGPVEKGVYQDFQNVYFLHPEFGRREHETVLSSGCERLFHVD